MKHPRPLAGAILLTFLLVTHSGHCQDDQSFPDLTKVTADPTSHNFPDPTIQNTADLTKVTSDLSNENTDLSVAETLQETPLNAHSQISPLGVEIAGADEYEDDPDDLEIQASEHEIEAVYSGSGASRPDPAGEEKPKKPKRRRRRRRRRKRIRTSTSGYEDIGEKNSDLGDLPVEPQDVAPPPEVPDYPVRRPNKRRRKPTTPIPIEEEYLLTAKTSGRRTTATPSIAPSYVPSEAPSYVLPVLPSRKPLLTANRLPANIEEIIERETPQDSLKIKQKINSVPPVVVLTTKSDALPSPVPTAITPTKNAAKSEERPVDENPLAGMSPELMTPHGKQNKINVRLSEPILFVTAPQDNMDYSEPRVTQAVKQGSSKLTTTARPAEVTQATTSKPTLPPSTHQPTAETQRSISHKKFGGVHPSRDTASKENSKENSSREVSRNAATVSTSTTEKTVGERKPIRRLPPVGTLFRKRPSTPQSTTETSKFLEDTTVSKENELTELNLYKETPLELQKVGPVKLNEIPPTSKVNTFKPLKDNSAHEKELNDNSLYRREEFKLKYTSTTTPLPVKYASSTQQPAKHATAPPIPVKYATYTGEERITAVHNQVKYPPSNSHLAKHAPSGTKTAYTPNIDLIIDYTSSTKKPTTTSTEQSIQISTADESLNTISHSGEFKPLSEDEATRINLEIPRVKEDTPQVKDDILIFLKSKAESNKLSRILQSRNMTLNELIEHRERGSSQLHLAEIFKSSPKAIPEADFELSPFLTEVPSTEQPTLLGSFPNSISQEVIHQNSPDHRHPKLLFDSLPQFPPMEAEASQTVYTTQRFGPELHYTRSRPLLPNAKITPFYGSSEELILSYTSSTGRPLVGNYGNDIVNFREFREHDSISHGNKRIPSELKSVITISGAIIAFAVLGFFVLLISCKVRHRKSQKFIKAGMLREHLREANLRSSTRSDTPVVKSGYYAGCDHTSDTSSTARQTYLWKTIRKTFRYE